MIPPPAKTKNTYFLSRKKKEQKEKRRKTKPKRRARRPVRHVGLTLIRILIYPQLRRGLYI